MKIQKHLTKNSFIDEGSYHVRLISSGETRTKNQKTALSVTFEILQAPFNGRRVKGLFTFNDDEEFNVMLRVMVKALGGNPESIEDSEQLHGRECIIHVAINESEEYGKQNVIKSYYPLFAREEE